MITNPDFLNNLLKHFHNIYPEEQLILAFNRMQEYTEKYDKLLFFPNRGWAISDWFDDGMLYKCALKLDTGYRPVINKVCNLYWCEETRGHIH